MTFDIRQLDKVYADDPQAEAAVQEYQDALVELFYNSPEGQERGQIDPDICYHN